MGNTARHNIKLIMYLTFSNESYSEFTNTFSNTTIVSKKGQNNVNTMYACKNYNFLHFYIFLQITFF